ncbi:MAG: amidohydrolase [Clostridia bacterium]|nr:amidohydrolase [Clostridia bacterium]
MLTMERLSRLVDQNLAWAIETRRALHEIPETGFQEVKTRRLICEKLDEIGCEYKEENGWITAFVKGAKEGLVTGIRADFDALPVTEPEGCPFRSKHEGWMHACGHDMHTAMLLTAGKIANEIKDELPGGVKLLFQPAEESVGGAKPMVEGGVMENPTVDRVYGLHVMPRLVTGNVETRPNTLNASTDTIKITVKGTSSHGAYPENGADAIVCAAQIITALQSVVARNVSPLDSAVITLGMIEGGRAGNIICDEVKMKGTLRTANKTLREMMIKRIEEISEMIASGMGCTAIAEVSEGYSALVNTPEHAERILNIAAELFGKENALVKDAPSMGGEDFSYFLDKAPGAFFHVGCSPDKDHIGAPLHSELFNPDESCMKVGILMELALAIGE